MKESPAFFVAVEGEAARVRVLGLTKVITESVDALLPPE